MSCEETILDAPVTPGPVFAYRALRGIFFGSPDSPAVTNDRKTLPDHNKENAPNKSPSPSKSRLGDVSVRLTPSQKRKRSSGAAVVLSPTKSCLRTPGVHTPRREMLRDINVTFNDALLRRLSPELMKSTTENPRNAGDAQLVERWAALEVARPADDDSATGIKSVRRVAPVKMSRGTAHEQLQPQGRADGKLATAADVDLQAYVETTEKEMKKLIRYSQKMRDYARKQDAENTKLKEMIEELRKDNQRLKRQVDIAGRDGDEAGAGDGDVLDLNGNDERHGKRMRIHSAAVRPSEVPKSTRRILGSTSANRTTHVHQNLTKELNLGSDVNRRTHLVENTRLQTGPENLGSGVKSIPEAIARASTSSREEAKVSRTPQEINNQPSNTSQATGTTGLPSMNLNPHLRPNSGPEPNLDLAPDRLAAARARLRQRSEMRKNSGTRTEIPNQNGMIFSVSKTKDETGNTIETNGRLVSKQQLQVLPIDCQEHTVTKASKKRKEGTTEGGIRDANENGNGKGDGKGDADGTREKETHRESSMLDWAGL